MSLAQLGNTGLWPLSLRSIGRQLRDAPSDGRRSSFAFPDWRRFHMLSCHSTPGRRGPIRHVTKLGCVLRGLPDTDSNSCRTAFQFLSDTVLIPVGQWSRLLSDSFGASLDWCPAGLERCPVWIRLVSDTDWNPGPEGVERRWNGCQGSRSIQVNRERHLMAQNK